MHYLAIDPGEQNTGWASFDANGDTLGMGKIKGDPNVFMDWLETLNPQPKVIIYENYRINPTISHGFSKVVTSQLIGMIKRYGHKQHITLVEQPNTVLKIGLKYIGAYDVYYDKKGKKLKHVDDAMSAMAHGVFFLQGHGIRESRVL